MSATTTSAVATRLTLPTITQFLSAQSSLADALAGRDRRRAVLLRSAPEWDGPAEHVWGDGRSARIAAAPSPLAVHELLLAHLSEAATGPDVLVILTDREQHELDPALLARAHRQRVDTVDRWNVVRDAFGAEQVELRLRDEKWAGEALLDAAPPRGGWPRLGGHVLSRRTALSALALRRLGLGSYRDETLPQDHTASADRLDTHTLLGWSLLPGGPERFLALRGPERTGLSSFLGEADQAGLGGRALMALVQAEHGPDAVAFGLVCAALWCHAEPDAAVYQARGRAERWFGDPPPARGEQLDAMATAFGRAAEEYVGILLAEATRNGAGPEEAREARRTGDTVLERASVLVRQFGAEAAARTSPLLPAGLEARFTEVGTALAAGEPGPLDAAVQSLSEHRRADVPDVRARIERTRMAGRLLRWLATEPAVETQGVGEAMDRHLRETAWVDRALEHIEAGGDPDDRLRAAYDALAERARERRHEIDRDFARELAHWTADGNDPRSGPLTVETFLERVVKPVVRGTTDRRVLLIVLDGMSAAIATELGEELRSSWAEFDPVGEDSPRRRAMAAALPTLTSVSRTSLFSGKLSHGSQKDEAKRFPALPLWRGAPAAVFHKDDLRSDSAGDVFGPALTEALMDGRTHVAVVLNAIDDRLAKEQKLGDGSWRAEHVPGLQELLRVAASQGMAVVLTSDHGHVVDRRGRKVETGSALSARHRSPGGAVGTAEVALQGSRVVAPEPDGSIVALWDADSRYTARKAGYHGGASLAEFTIPVLAFLPFGATPPPAWRELGDQRPAWWEGEAATSTAGTAPHRETASAPARQTRRRPTASQTHLARTHDALFDVTMAPAREDQDALVTPELVGPDDALVAALLASETFTGQMSLLARKPPLDKVEKAIRALVDAGGTLPVTALAQRVSYPATRADGFAAILRQLLNYDGVQVLETLPDGRTVRLHLSLLRMQFGLA